MGKPDLVLRSRPLREVEPALKLLKGVVLFHPDPIVQELPSKYCFCRKPELRKKEAVGEMIECETCLEWYHFDCIGIADTQAASATAYKCNWCKSGVDKQGKQRWKISGGRDKLRHYNDTPRAKNERLGQEIGKQFTALPYWEGKVLEVKEIARRAALFKKKLADKAEEFVVGKHHHLVDAVGMSGLEARPVDDALLDELLAAEEIALSDDEEGGVDE